MFVINEIKEMLIQKYVSIWWIFITKCNSNSFFFLFECAIEILFNILELTIVVCIVDWAPPITCN